MGTRADFYIGRGAQAEWVGSIAWDGYPDGLKKPLLRATTKDEFMQRLEEFWTDRDDVTRPQDGWPWPWNNSATTDYAYAFDDGKVWASAFGNAWFDPLKPQPEEPHDDGSVVFPDMTHLKNNPPLGSKKSGLTVFGY